MNHYLGLAVRENNQRFVEDVKKVSEVVFKQKLTEELEKVPLKQPIDECVKLAYTYLNKGCSVTILTSYFVIRKD